MSTRNKNTALPGSSRKWNHSSGRIVQARPQIRKISVNGPADATNSRPLYQITSDLTVDLRQLIALW